MRTPDLPAAYFAVIFTSHRTDAHDDEYAAVAARMAELAEEQPGFLGIDSARDPDGRGITVSYWRSEADIAAWKAVAEHVDAQRAGRSRFYDWYSTRVARVERQYEYRADGSDTDIDDEVAATPET